MNNSNQHSTGQGQPKLPPISSQRQVLNQGVTSPKNDKEEALRSLALAEQHLLAYSPLQNDQSSATSAAQIAGTSGKIEERNVPSSPSGAFANLPLLEGLRHENSQEHLRGGAMHTNQAKTIKQFIAPPGSLDELMMHRTREELKNQEKEEKKRAKLHSGYKHEDQEKQEKLKQNYLPESFRAVQPDDHNIIEVQTNQGTIVHPDPTSAGAAADSNKYHKETKISKKASSMQQNIGNQNNKGEEHPTARTQGAYEQNMINYQNRQYVMMPGMHSDQTDFKPAILDDIYEDQNKLSVDDCWIIRDQDVMIVFNWAQSKLHRVDIKHNGVQILENVKSFDKEALVRLGIQGDRQGFNFRISNNLDYLLIRYQNLIATAEIKSLEDLFSDQFNLSEALQQTCKVVIQSNQEKLREPDPVKAKKILLSEGTDKLPFQIASVIIDDQDHVVLASRVKKEDKRNLLIHRFNDNIKELHNFLKTLDQDELYFSLDKYQKTIQTIPFVPLSIGHSISDVYFQHQRGCQFVFVTEKDKLTYVYRPELGERGLIKVRHKEDVFKSKEIFYRTKDGALFIKSDQMILLYKYDGINGEPSYREEARIIKEKRDLSSDSQLMKVYEKFVYMIKESDITILDFESQKVVTKVKVVGILNQPMYQMQNSPTIVDKSGFHNVFYPEPFLTHHSTHVGEKGINEYSNGIQLNQDIIVRHASRFLRKKIEPFIDQSQYIEQDEKTKTRIIDYIPELFLVLLDRVSQNKGSKRSLVLRDLKNNGSEIVRDDINFGKFVHRAFLREPLGSQQNEDQNELAEMSKFSLIYIKYDINLNPMKTNSHLHAFKSIKIPLTDYSKIEERELFTLDIDCENSYNEIDHFYCWQRNEIFVKYQKVNEVKFTELYTLNVNDGFIIATKHQLQSHVERPIFFTNRLIYYKENISGALEIKKIIKRGKTFDFDVKPLHSHQNIKNVFEIIRLHNIVLIQLTDDSFYLTDVDCHTIKTHIKNLFNGFLTQDRSLRNNIYVRNCEKKQVFILNLFNNSPNSIPYQLLMKNNLFTLYNHETRVINFYKNLDQTSDVDIVSQIKMRTWSNPYMDLQKKHDKNSKQWWDMSVFIYPYTEIVKKMKSINIYDLLSYNVINRKHLIYEAIMFDEIFKKIIQLIEDLPETDHKPYIFPDVLNRDKKLLEQWKSDQNENNGKQNHNKQVLIPVENEQADPKEEQKYLVGAFDMAIDLEERLIIQNLLNLMIISDPYGCLYSNIVAENIDNFILFKLSLKEYFSSSMPIILHEEFDYPQFHNLDKSLYMGVNFDKNSSNVHDVTKEKYYDTVMKPKLDKAQIWEDRNWFDKYLNPIRPMIYYCKKRIEKFKKKRALKHHQTVHPQVHKPKEHLHNDHDMSQMPLTQHQPDSLHEPQPEQQISVREDTQLRGYNDDEELYEIEYSLVNMPKLLTGNESRSKQFMRLVQEEADKDITFLEIPVIQMIINFKWKKYTEVFFVRQFVKTFLFIIAFIIEIILTSPYGLTDEESDNSFIAHIITRLFCALIMLDHFRYEVRQLQANDFKKYFQNDYWNIFDVLIFVLYLAYIPIAFIYDNSEYIVKIIQCSILFLFQIKFNFYLRIFDKFGFLVQMIVTVFYDLRYFLLYFCIIISFFSIQISIIMKDVEDHDGIGPIMFFVMTLRTSLGDNDIDQQYSEYKILFWIIWFLIMVVGNIVLMNFIIAVVGQSYGECMEKQVAQSYKVKVDMIVEREQMMTSLEFERKKQKYFPEYILVRRPMDRDAIKVREEEQRMELLTKEVRRISLSVAEIKNNQRHKSNDDIKDIKEMLKMITSKIGVQNNSLAPQ